MNERAAAAIAGRPTLGEPPLICNEPDSEKKEATASGFWLHHAAV